MSCKNCEENPVETYVRIGNGNVMIVGCVEHLRELIMKLRGDKEEEMTKHQWVEQAKEEARLNLTGEDLEKCFKALEAWERNTQTE